MTRKEILEKTIDFDDAINRIARLEASRPEWHDLRKDPNDLPDNLRYVWTNVGAGYHNEDGWWDAFGRLQNVIAWCEPKFEEEINERN